MSRFESLFVGLWSVERCEWFCARGCDLNHFAFENRCFGFSFLSWAAFWKFGVLFTLELFLFFSALIRLCSVLLSHPPALFKLLFSQ